MQWYCLLWNGVLEWTRGATSRRHHSAILVIGSTPTNIKKSISLGCWNDWCTIAAQIEGKKYVPLDLRPKKTKKIRQALKAEQKYAQLGLKNEHTTMKRHENVIKAT